MEPIKATNLPVRELPSLKTLDVFGSQLSELAGKYRDAYVSAQPFPHGVIDDLFPEELLLAIREEALTATKPISKAFYGSEAKQATKGRASFGPVTDQFLSELNSEEFLRFLEGLTGIEGLIADPTFEGGGVHQIKRHGFLKMHTDFNYHHRLRLDRRINALVYLNPDWNDDWGGHLELWSGNKSDGTVKIAPRFNRMVLFSTTDYSFHGHPDPLQCPEDVSRLSLALYYYTNGRPKSEIRRRSVSTRYLARDGERFEKRGIMRASFAAFPASAQIGIHKLLRGKASKS